jgi:hypothetical protein
MQGLAEIPRKMQRIQLSLSLSLSLSLYKPPRIRDLLSLTNTPLPVHRLGVVWEGAAMSHDRLFDSGYMGRNGKDDAKRPIK